MKKKKKFKKKFWLLFVLLLIIVIIVFLVLREDKEESIQEKLSQAGCTNQDIESVIKKVSADDYETVLELKCSDTLINLLNADGYKEENFNKYLNYYNKNTNSNINDIITIVNSGYDLEDYPASSLLANLVLEKYYINDNVSRYLDYGNSHDVDAETVIKMVNAKADYPFYTNTNKTNIEDNNLMLVNKFYYLESNYVPNDLVTLSSTYNTGINSKMRKEAADAFMQMADAALLDNIVIKNASAYRSYDYQVNLYNGYVKRDGKENADIYSARPGYSEHQTGLCTDINDISSNFEGTPESNWLIDNAYKYGFILRFPKGKENITGYKYEPWHYRYVGTEAAKIIYEEDLTLEEYYEYYVTKNR